MSSRAEHLTARLQGFGETIFAEMTALAVRTGAVNLGQGFPDFDCDPALPELSIAVDLPASASTAIGAIRTRTL